MSDSHWRVHAAHTGALVVVLGAIAAKGGGLEAFWFGEWATPFLVLNLGIVAANEVSLRMAVDSDAIDNITRLGRQADLEDNRALIVQQLRSLEQQRDKHDPEDYAQEREQLLAIGAEALRELDGAIAQAPAPARQAVDSSLVQEIRALQQRDATAFDAALAELGIRSGGMAGEWRGAAWTLLVVALVALLMQAAGQGSKARPAGGSMTGGESVGMGEAPMQPAPAPAAAPSARMTALKTALEADPANLEALNELTELSLSSRDLGGAMQANLKALEVAPTDLDARTYKGVLTAFIGRTDLAIEMFNEVLAESPDHHRALVYKGLIALEAGQNEEAIASLEHAIRVEDNPMLRQALARAKGGGAPPAPPPPAAGGEVFLSGTVTAVGVDPSAYSTLYISMRDPAGGPPLGAVKLPPGPFPMDFQVTAANLISMGGARPVPGKVNLQVRLDLDGNAMSKDPSEPSVTLEAVEKGSTGLEVALGGAAPAAGPAPIAAGTITLAPGTPTEGFKTMWVSMRDPAGGPPLGARQLPIGPFPMNFELTSAHVISMGGPRAIPGQVNIQVRMDKDGQPMSKDPSEPIAVLNGVTTGTTGLDFTLAVP